MLYPALVTFNLGRLTSMPSVKSFIRKLPPVSFLLSLRTKQSHELDYWKSRYRAEGPLHGSHFQRFYTDVFGLTTDDYAGKKILDIGCGPRGSLEWANMAEERVGLDPLADKYMKLGAANHKMTYVASPSEQIPFPDGHFDIVTSFNSLDHVDDLARTIHEIKRVAKPNGRFLLIVEIDHPPTPTEPLTLTKDILNSFAPEFRPVKHWASAMGSTHDVYGSILAAKSATPGEPAILCANLARQNQGL